MNKYFKFFLKYIISTYLCLFFLTSFNFALAFSEPGVSVFMYHRFGESKYPSTNVTKEQFISHINYVINQNINIVSLKEVVQKLKNGEKFTNKSISFSVDDAYSSFFDFAWPIFKKNKIPITLFVSTDIIDNNTKGYMSWSEINQFIEEGGTVGQHTASHGQMPLSGKADIKNDILRSHKSFVKNIGYIPELFAYPYGEASKEVIEIIKEYKIDSAFGQHSGVISSHDNHFYLPRFSLNERFGEIERFKFSINSYPLIIKDFIPTDMFLNDIKKPIIEFTILNDLHGNQVQCFSNTGGIWKSQKVNNISKNRIQINLIEEYHSGRGRLNCTSKILGNWHWFGYQFLVR